MTSGDAEPIRGFDRLRAVFVSDVRYKGCIDSTAANDERERKTRDTPAGFTRQRGLPFSSADGLRSVLQERLQLFQVFPSARPHDGAADQHGPDEPWSNEQYEQRLTTSSGRRILYII